MKKVVTKAQVQALLHYIKVDEFQPTIHAHGVYFDIEYEEVGEYYTPDYAEDTLTKTILDCIPVDIVAIAIHQVFGLGDKPSRNAYRHLNQFRQSDTASMLYALWQGREYQPVLASIPTTRGRHRNSPLVTYIPSQYIARLSAD